jgi:hypothetical protein
MTGAMPAQRVLARPRSGQDGTTGHAWGGDAEFGAGAVDELADGRLAPPGARAALSSASYCLALGGLDAGVDVEGPVAEFEASVKIRLGLGQSMPSTMRKSRSTPSERATSASR